MKHKCHWKSGAWKKGGKRGTATRKNGNPLPVVCVCFVFDKHEKMHKKRKIILNVGGGEV